MSANEDVFQRVMPPVIDAAYQVSNVFLASRPHGLELKLGDCEC
jgi:hypothetical protein